MNPDAQRNCLHVVPMALARPSCDRSLMKFVVTFLSPCDLLYLGVGRVVKGNCIKALDAATLPAGKS